MTYAAAVVVVVVAVIVIEQTASATVAVLHKNTPMYRNVVFDV